MAHWYTNKFGSFFLSERQRHSLIEFQHIWARLHLTGPRIPGPGATQKNKKEITQVWLNIGVALLYIIFSCSWLRADNCGKTKSGNELSVLPQLCSSQPQMFFFVFFFSLTPRNHGLPLLVFPRLPASISWSLTRWLASRNIQLVFGWWCVLRSPWLVLIYCSSMWYNVLSTSGQCTVGARIHPP